MSPLKQVMNHTSGQELEGNQLAAMVSDPCLCGSYALISHLISCECRGWGDEQDRSVPLTRTARFFYRYSP